MTTEALTLNNAPIITFGYLMQVFISLLVVLALIYFLARYFLPRLKFTPAGKLIKVLDRIYLEPQVAAYIIQVGRSAWLIAVSHKHITKIDQINIETLTEQHEKN